MTALTTRTTASITHKLQTHYDRQPTYNPLQLSVPTAKWLGTHQGKPTSAIYINSTPKIHYTDAQSQNGAPEHSVSLLDPRGERSLGASPMGKLKAAGEVGAELA